MNKNNTGMNIQNTDSIIDGNINDDFGIVDSENLVLDKINENYYKYIRIGSKISIDLAKKK